jgi:hypothetical protein
MNMLDQALPMPQDADAWRARIKEVFSAEDRKRLREATPVSWIGEREYEDISHDCA